MGVVRIGLAAAIALFLVLFGVGAAIHRVSAVFGS